LHVGHFLVDTADHSDFDGLLLSRIWDSTFDLGLQAQESLLVHHDILFLQSDHTDKRCSLGWLFFSNKGRIREKCRF
jgi:hypothetical protein